MNTCVICGNGPADKHHLKTRGSGGTDDDFNLINLCRVHHVQIHRIGVITFIEAHSLQNLILSKGWKITNHFGRKKLERVGTDDIILV